jgi:hypothetical protein
MNISVLRRVQIGCVVVMHVAAVALVLRVMDSSNTASTAWRWLHLAVVMGMSFLVDRLVGTAPRAWRGRVWSAAGAGVIALLSVSLLGGWSVVVSPTRDVQALGAVVLGLAWLWRRGPLVTLLDQRALAATWQRTILLLLVLATLGTAFFESPDAAALAADVVVFVAGSLLALALTNIAIDAERGEHRRWVATAVVPVVLLVLLGVIGAALVSPALRQAVVALIGGLLAGMSVLVAPLAALLSLLVAAVHAALAGAGAAASPLPSAAPLEKVAPTPVPTGGSDIPLYVWLVSVALRAMVVLAFVIVVWLVLRWAVRQWQRPRQLGDERTSVWSWRDLQHDLRNLLRTRLPQLRQGPAGLAAALRALRGQDSATRIRRAYIRLLLRAEGRDRGRAPSQTPHEYEGTAAQLAPHVGQQVTLLTHAYEHARYGASPSPDTAAAAEQALQQIDHEIKRTRQ